MLHRLVQPIGADIVGLAIGEQVCLDHKPRLAVLLIFASGRTESNVVWMETRA